MGIQWLKVDYHIRHQVGTEFKKNLINCRRHRSRNIAVEIFRNADCPFELMHCVSTYPMDDEDANLNCIMTLRDRYQCGVGYSGHEVGLAVSYAAAAMGITSLERHITLDRAMYGSDQAASVEVGGFIALVGAVRKIEKAMGDGVIGIHEKEVPIARKLRAHIPWGSSG